MKKKFSSKYGEYEVTLNFLKYVGGQNRIDLIDSEDGFPVAVASVSIKEDLKEDEVAIKNYSENKGVLNFLIREGIISKPLRYFNSAYVKIPICNIISREFRNF